MLSQQINKTMSSSLNIPFVKASTWNCEGLRDENQLQRCFENRGEIDADISFYSVNYDSQLYGYPLHQPYDPPSYMTCLDGPEKCAVNGDFCITNVVSRPVYSCTKMSDKTPPLCYPGLIPKMIGCGEDKDGVLRSQWQCLPTWKTNERRISPANMNS